MNISGLIVGLGNPGREYELTRHNFGFLFADAVCQAAQDMVGGRCDTLTTGKKKYELWRCDLIAGQDPWLVAKPLTFMNLSGEAVIAIASYYRIKPSQIVVVHDELSLPLGRMRFKLGGGNAGHNGLKSITQCLGTPDFYRLRLGIGRPEHEGPVTNWVLGRFAASDTKVLESVLDAGLEGLHTFAKQGLNAATMKINSFKI
ncbi:MAG: aminoacyl-tRNA hydrolase [Pseudomonadota bacterium]